VDSYSQLIISQSLGLRRPKYMKVLRAPKLFNQFAGGIVISVDQIHADSCICQTRHLFIEKQRRLETLEPGVVKVARDDKEIHFFGNRGFENLLERAPCGVPYLGCRSAGILSEALKWRIEMDIGAVDEPHVPGAHLSMRSLNVPDI
jgi:hypothetical protein